MGAAGTLTEAPRLVLDTNVLSRVPSSSVTQQRSGRMIVFLCAKKAVKKELLCG